VAVVIRALRLEAARLLGRERSIGTTYSALHHPAPGRRHWRRCKDWQVR